MKKDLRNTIGLLVLLLALIVSVGMCSCTKTETVNDSPQVEEVSTKASPPCEYTFTDYYPGYPVPSTPAPITYASGTVQGALDQFFNDNPDIVTFCVVQTCNWE